jgi:hypothetical protein
MTKKEIISQRLKRAIRDTEEGIATLIAVAEGSAQPLLLLRMARTRRAEALLRSQIGLRPSTVLPQRRV